VDVLWVLFDEIDFLVRDENVLVVGIRWQWRCEDDLVLLASLLHGIGC
jgi:hypothetical protein